ncbi:hypothetical protein AJ80_03118 [Polytolypa hystricis UAMH7299]|uniref:Altered inheritance of mitochondria protein 9, mitochondrial n=1 Tax=Polytolypa hystricis (strain UAMH7299) TaxID=1447883 RepID=A0A2B7YL35_POLH7|nr:hypothetical protein AJ80_03118 [Polytolypa hystricis UAMH7299]
MSRLLKLAVSVIGSKSCVQVVKVSEEGQYNKVFLLTMSDGREVIAKLPNPNADRPHFTTASEVATMDFLRNVFHLPIPRAGVMLSDVWESMKGKQKAQIVLQVVDIEKTLASTKFTKLGALYYKDDIPATLDTTTPLYVDGDGNDIHSTKYDIGPTNHRAFFDFGRGELDIDRGPLCTPAEFMTAIAYREIACARAGLRYPLMPQGLFYGPRQYQPSTLKKLSALHSYLTIAPYVLPENRATHASVLWHGDLHLQNIFVDPEEPTRILGIIDWQSVSTCPLFMQVTRPGFLDYNGPVPQELGKVHLPANFDSMIPDEQQKAKALHQAQTLHNLYLARSCQVNTEAFQAMQGQDTFRHQEQDEELWARGVELMDDFVYDTGCFKHWDGRVSDADYQLSKRQLAEGIERCLSREVRDEEERKAWLNVLPFVD